MKRFLTVTEKKTICEEAYAEPRKVRSTAEANNVSPAQIRRWRGAFAAKDADTVRRKSKKGAKTFHKGPAFKDADVHHHLEAYFEAWRDCHRAVTIRMMRLELVRIKPATGQVSVMAQTDRIRRFLAARGIVQRRTTHVAQNMTFDAAEMEDFVNCLNELIAHKDLDCIVNMDETNVNFDQPPATTLSLRGEQTISIKTTGSSCRATAMLAVTMGGEKLKPLLVFKGTPNGRVAKGFGQDCYPRGLAYATQNNAWVDVTVFEKWIRQVWKPFCQSREPRPTILIMDSFTVHKTSAVLQQLHACGTMVEIITAGYTSQLQVLDVGINKPFKNYIRESYESWMRDHLGAKVQRPDVATWVDEAWYRITGETIVNTWRTIGFEK